MNCFGSIRDFIQEYSYKYNRLHGHSDKDGNYTRAGKANIVSDVALLALCMVSYFAATGVLSTAVAGGIAVGVGVVVLLTQVPFYSKNKYYKMDLVSTVFFAGSIAAMGGCGAAGMVSAVRMGYGLISLVISKFIFDYGLGRMHADNVRD